MTTKTKKQFKIQNKKNRIKKQVKVVFYLPVYKQGLLAYLDASKDFQADEWLGDFPLPYCVVA